MGPLLQVLGLVVGVAAVAGLARRLNLSSPILLVVLGLAVSFVPGMPAYRLDPELVLVLFLPPLVYSAAVSSDLTAVRANARPIALLSVGLVVFTAGVVALVAKAVVPGLPWAAAIALGGILGPTDAVAAVAIARRLGLPARLLTVLEGESLLNDATALVTYRVAVTATVSGTVALSTVGWRVVVAVVGGVAIGVAAAYLIAAVRRRTDDPLIENTLSLLTPFLAYLPAEAIGASGVLAVVVAGLRLSHDAPVLMSPAARLQSHAIWALIDFLLEGVVFALIGLQLPDIIRQLDGGSLPGLVGGGVALTAAVVIGRIVWVFPATYLPRWASKRVRARDPYPDWRIPATLSWSGMRGVVSLAAAFALPLTIAGGRPFPRRDELIFLTLFVIVATLLGQGFTLPHVVRWSGLRRDETAELLAEAAAQQQAAKASLARLDALTGEPDTSAQVTEQLRQRAELRQLSAWERLGSGSGGTLGAEPPTATYRRLRLEMLRAERLEFLAQRDAGRISDEVLRRVQRDLDLEEAILNRG
jgi:CPA1 family monovalent cation:H+ antiporter